MSSKDHARLGRGLAALLGDAALPPQAMTGARTVPIMHLRPGPFQPRARIDPADIADLVESVRTRGILQPLLARPDPVTPGLFQIIAGERRWRAAQTAGLNEVPVLVREFSDGDALASALVENLQRVDLNPIEEAEGYRRLIDEFGLTQEHVGQAVGKSRSHVANTMRLLNLPPSVQGEVRKGALSAGHARALLAHREPEKAALSVIARGLNVRQTEEMCSEREPRAPDPVRDPDIMALEKDLADRLGLKVELTSRGTGGTLKIFYSSLDQLDGVLRLLNQE